MDEKNKWYSSWPAIVVLLLAFQFLGLRYIQSLPDAADKYYELAAFIFLYVVFATFIIIRKRNQESDSKLQELAKQDREKQKLINQINELEETIEKLKDEKDNK